MSVSVEIVNPMKHYSFRNGAKNSLCFACGPLLFTSLSNMGVPSASNYPLTHFFLKLEKRKKIYAFAVLLGMY